MSGASGTKLDETYKLAWLRGLKTTYYLRTQSATHVEMSTVNRRQLNSVPSDDDARAAGADHALQAESEVIASDIRFCAIDDSTCEACQ